MSLLVWASAGIALAQQYTISTVAGGAPPLTPAAGSGLSIGVPQRVTLDLSGNLYFTSLNCVFRLDASGTLTRIAGNSRAGYSGDGAPALQAQLNSPAGLAIDSAGDIFIADSGNNVIRKITADGNIHTFAGNGTPGFSGDGNPAIQAQLLSPAGVTVDSSGNVYIADTGNSNIREVTTDGNINTFAGSGFRGFAGDTDAATNAELNVPEDVFVASNGTLYIADTGNADIRAVAPGTINNVSVPVINTVVGSTTIGYQGDGAAATKASLFQPWSVVVDSAGNIYIAEYGNNIIRMVNTSGNISTIVGNTTLGFSGDGSKATSAMLNQPTGVVVDGSGNVYIADSWNHRIRKVSSGNINTIAGNGVLSYSGDGGPATSAQMNGPLGVAIDQSGNLYIADSGNAAVRHVTPTGLISTYGNDPVVRPQGVAVDAAGNIYVADPPANVVREIAVSGAVTTFAGTGTAGYTGDGGPAGSATLNSPTGVAVDVSGNIYIADYGNHAIRVVAAGGNIHTIAGNGTAGYNGDSVAATQASLNFPLAVAVDHSGNVYIADSANHRVREMTTDGIIHTIAGTGVAGYTGDGGAAVDAEIVSARGIAVDPSGSVFFTDGGSRIREIYGGYINTIAGNGTAGYTGDGGGAIEAELNGPTALAVDNSGNLYVADTANNAIRKLQSAPPGITLEAVTNGASNLPGAVSPGEIVVLYGANMGPSGVVPYQLANGSFTTNLAGTSVFFDGIPAPIVYTVATQVGAIVPFEITGPNVQVFVAYQNQVSAPLTVSVVPAAPALFTTDEQGTGQAVAFNQNQQPNSASNPATAGSMLTLYATGLGQTSPAGNDGLIATAPLPTATLPVTVTIGGQPAPVQGTASGVFSAVAGLMEITVQVPAIAANAAAPVTLQVGSATAPAGVTVAVSQ